MGGGYLDLHNFRNRKRKPAQKAAGITPKRRAYDLRRTFATFALRAGISTFDLSRYMGTSLAMIDRHHGHLARDGRKHAIRLLDTHSRPFGVHAVDAAWTPSTTWVQRLNTSGGVAPDATCAPGGRVAVPYSADYFFWRAAADDESDD